MSAKVNVPQLRFKEFRGKWEEKKLGDMCNFTQGVQIPFSEQLTQYKNGTIRYLYIRDFFTDDFPYYVANKYPNKIIHSDEIMMVNTGNTAGKAFMGATGVLSNNAFKISFDKKKVSNIFLFQRLASNAIQRKIRSFFNAGGQPHLGHKNIAIVPMAFPNIEEQQKIASFLSTVDKKIEQLTKKQSLLASYKKGVMQEIFSQKIRFHPKGISSQVQGKAGDRSDYPEWEEKRLGEISIIIMGQSPDSKSYNDKNNGIFLIQGNADIKNRKSSPRQWTDEPTKLCEEGDLLLTVRAPVGSIAKALHKACIGRGICAIKNNQFSNIEFLYQFLLSFEKKWVKFEQGSTFAAVNTNDIKSLKIDLPSTEEQSKIANFLTSIDTKIDQNNQQLNQAKQFKKALLQQMFV